MLLLILGGISALVYTSGLCCLFLDQGRLLHFLNSLGSWGLAAFIGLQALQVIVAPIPGQVTGILGGYLYGPFHGTLFSTLGLTLGSSVAFLLSRTFGRPLVEKVVRQSLLDRFDRVLNGRGLLLVLLLFLLPGVPKDPLCYMLGLGPLSMKEFLVVGGFGRLFGTILLSFGGAFLKFHQYGKLVTLAAVAAAVVLLTMIYQSQLEKLLHSLQSVARQNQSDG